VSEDSEIVTEERLARALQPIRFFALAQALFAFMETGLHATLRLGGSMRVARLAEESGFDERRLRGFLRYLANERFVELTADDVVSLSESGSEIAVFRPWYTLLVGGYAGTFQQLPEVLANRNRYAARDSVLVGIGSCGISEFDALPITRRLLSQVSGNVQTVVDIGCGDGRFLVELCEWLPQLRGIGIEADEASATAARKLVSDLSLADRIEIRASYSSELPDLSGIPEPPCFITAFVLQEMIEQTNRSAILTLLTRAFARYPEAFWIVVEVDHRPADPAVMSHDLGLAYYNPYYLIHQITQQRLETRQFWEALFHDAGLRIVAVETPDPAYDSLGLKVGYLLASRSE
jgi:2-ketoarginine methyltransferase